MKCVVRPGCQINHNSKTLKEGEFLELTEMQLSEPVIFGAVEVVQEHVTRGAAAPVSTNTVKE